MKLSTRLSVDTTNTIREILLRFGSSLDVELQQRALEYSVIFTKYDSMRTGLLEAMPAYEKDLDGQTEMMTVEEETGPDLVNFGDAEGENSAVGVADSNQDLLADLLSGGGEEVVATPQVEITAGVQSSGSALGDLQRGFAENSQTNDSKLNFFKNPNMAQRWDFRFFFAKFGHLGHFRAKHRNLKNSNGAASNGEFKQTILYFRWATLRRLRLVFKAVAWMIYWAWALKNHQSTKLSTKSPITQTI